MNGSLVRREDVLHEIPGTLRGAPGNQAPHLPEPALDLMFGDDFIFILLIAPILLVLWTTHNGRPL